MTGKQKEKLGYILAIVVTLVLLVSVFVFAEYSKNFTDNNSANAKLMELENRSMTLIQSGKTLWQFKDDGVFPEQNKTGTNWNMPGYKQTDWNLGQGTFGSEMGKRTKKVDDRLPSNLLNFYTPNRLPVPVYYFRMEFNLNQIYDDWELSGRVEFDDSIIIYINGKKVFGSNVPSEGFSADGYGAEKTVDNSRTKQFSVSDTSMLRKGKNVVAVEVHQSSQYSDDIFFDFIHLKYAQNISANSLSRIPGCILELGDQEGDIKVNWLTKQQGDYVLQYAKANVQKVLKEYINVPLTLTDETEDEAFCYIGQMTNLEPGEDYTYRIASTDGKQTSAEYTYTAPINEKGFSFLFAGDPQIGANDIQNDTEGWSMALDIGLSLEKNASFILTAGDQIDSSKKEVALNEYFGFRKPEELKFLPVMVSRGNHEAKGSLYDLQFTDNEEVNNCFTYGDALFIRLDSNNKDFSANRKYIKEAISTHQKTWVIVVMHHSIFGSGAHATDKSIQKMRTAYAEFFSEMDVDLVLSGHDHVYSRSYLMKGKKSTGKDEGKKQTGETMYLSQNSASSSKLYEGKLTMYPYLKALQKKPNGHLTTVEISKSKLKINTYRLTDIKKIDYCVIQK
ncbi:hypothetical protein M2140_001247 [Clostridiales Family XIII bacterium PM5-7]